MEDLSVKTNIFVKVKTDYDDNDDSDFEMSDEEVEDEVLAQRTNILNIDPLLFIFIAMLNFS